MRRVGKIVDAPVRAVQASPSPYAYRNKAAWIIGPGGEPAYHEAPVATNWCRLTNASC